MFFSGLVSDKHISEGWLVKLEIAREAERKAAL